MEMNFSNSKSRILIVEPHPDDAFLSLSEHISMWIENGYSISLLTVFDCGERSSSSFCNSYGIEYYEDRLATFMNKGKDVSSEIRRTLKNSEYDSAIAYQSMKNIFGFEDKEILFPDKTKSFDLLILPLALSHPEHFYTRENFSKIEYPRVSYYADNPYSFKGFGKKMIDSYEYNERILISRARLTVESISNKIAKFSEFYPTESIVNDLPLIIDNSFEEKIYV